MDLVIQPAARALSALLASTAAMRRAANRCEQRQGCAAVHPETGVRSLAQQIVPRGIRYVIGERPRGLLRAAKRPALS